MVFALAWQSDGDAISVRGRMRSCCCPLSRPARRSGRSNVWPVSAGQRDGTQAGLAGLLLEASSRTRSCCFATGTTPLGGGGRGAHDSGELLAQVRAGHADAADLLVDWLLDCPASLLHVDVYDGDSTLPAVLLGAGFSAQPKDRSVGMFCPVRDGRPMPTDYIVRSVRAEETDARVEVHRTAWRPAAQPWDDGRRIDPTAESSFTHAAYEAVRRTWLYDPELDLVAVAPDGTLAGCCIVWQDEATGFAEIEPLGVTPKHRGRGVAGAMCIDAARRVAERGGAQLFINTGPRDEYPAPTAAYRKVGFKVVERATRYEFERNP
jgi:GNAT superfamily N-acetyltransferase